MARERAQIDLGGPLLREREGVKLTERSLSSRLAEIIDRLAIVAEHGAPADITSAQWDIILYEGWDALSSERIISRARPQDIDRLAWHNMVSAVAERDESLAKRLTSMRPIERIAVLERIEAYGRAEAMTEAPSA